MFSKMTKLERRLYVVLREQGFWKRTTESQRSGDHAGGVPPVPIPNTEVKTSRAENTWGIAPGKVGHRQVTSDRLP